MKVLFCGKCVWDGLLFFFYFIKFVWCLYRLIVGKKIVIKLINIFFFYFENKFFLDVFGGC